MCAGGYTALWTVFTIFGLASLAFTGLALNKPVAKKDHFCEPWQPACLPARLHARAVVVLDLSSTHWWCEN